LRFDENGIVKSFKGITFNQTLYCHNLKKNIFEILHIGTLGDFQE